jgi:DNA-binding NarL/FixJ family response regulator
MASNPIRIVLADDHTLFRDGMKRLLAADSRFAVVGEAAGGDELLDIYRGSGADVVFMDIDMPGMNGIEASRRLLEIDPEVRIITLSMHGDREYYLAMVDVGAKGFLLKNSTFDQVAAAAETVAVGGTYFSQELLASLATDTKHSGELSHGEALSQREIEVLPLVCEGYSNQQIADRLFISKRTVDKHRANILDKTGCKNTASLVIYAVKHNLIEI